MFASGDQRISLGVKTSPPISSFGLTLVVPSGVELRPGRVTVAFGDTAPLDAVLREQGKLRSGGTLMIISLERPVLQPLLAAKTLSVKAGRKTLTFVTGGVDGGRILGDCENDLFKRWGVDPQETESHVAVKAIPAPDIANWIRNADYPSAARKAGIQGTTTMLWRIEANGRIEDCRIIESSGSALLDDKACEVLKLRGRYQPARDDQGRAMPMWQRRVSRWRL